MCGVGAKRTTSLFTVNMAIRCVIFGRAVGRGAAAHGVFGDVWTDSAVILIRYVNFATGTHDVTALHGRAERGTRGVTIYLLPGLTAGQRRRAIRRLRQEASRGFGPPLPLLPLAIALGRDRVAAAARTARAAVRLHPAVTLLPGAFLAVLMTLFVMAASGNSMRPAHPSASLAAAVGGTGHESILAARPHRASAMLAVNAGGTGLGKGDPVRAESAGDGLPPHAKGTRFHRARRQAAWYACPQATARGGAPREPCSV
jgi:hypothetical protein